MRYPKKSGDVATVQSPLTLSGREGDFRGKSVQLDLQPGDTLENLGWQCDDSDLAQYPHFPILTKLRIATKEKIQIIWVN